MRLVGRSWRAMIVSPSQLEPTRTREPWPMPYFYFHVWRGGQLTPDEVGLSLPTVDAAKRMAESIASSIIDQGECAPGSLSGWDIEVTDHEGRTFLIVPVGKRSPDAKRSRAA
jgi:hypothetical protein